MAQPNPFQTWLTEQTGREDDVGTLARLAASTPDLHVTQAARDFKLSLSAHKRGDLAGAADKACQEFERGTFDARTAEVAAATKAQVEADLAAEDEARVAREKRRAELAARVTVDARVEKLKAQAASDARHQAAVEAEQAEREADEKLQLAKAEAEAKAANAGLLEADEKPRKPRKSRTPKTEEVAP